MTPTADISGLADSTNRLLSTVARLDAAAYGGPSMLPGWTRSHVLTHIARNADGMRNLLLSARTGEPFGLYASREVRNADIEAGATRPPAVIADDVEVAAQRLAVEIAALPEPAWAAVVAVSPGVPGSPSFPATTIVTFRLFEVDVHHVDLAAGYDFEDIPAELLPPFVERALSLLGDRAPAALLQPDDREGTWGLGSGATEVTVSGASSQLLGWLLGRTDGSALRASAGSQVPVIPSLT